VLANGKPLPFRDSPNYPYVQFDSLVIIAYHSPKGDQYSFAGVFPNSSLYFSASTRPTALVCAEPGAMLFVSATEMETAAKGATTTIGGCAAAYAAFSFARKGDSLAGTWGGADVRLVKRSP